jgi:hypothetical protein
MTHPAIRLSIAVAVAALLVAPGCKKAQDAALETAIEGATGNKVDVQKDGNEMTIKTEQGDLRIATAEDGGSVAMPANFPRTYSCRPRTPSPARWTWAACRCST